MASSYLISLMKNFELRRDRFDFFESFESPILNLTLDLEVPNFMSFCKREELPVFHFFLFFLMKSLNELDHFKYRIVNGEVIKNDLIHGSYTVLNQDQLFNYTCFKYQNNVSSFISESLKAREISTRSKTLLNTAIEESSNTTKDYVFITSLPWFNFTSIQHPIYKFKSSDVPSIAWGKFNLIDSNKIRMPFSIQVHHGFVDGLHIHQLMEKISSSIEEGMRNFTK